MQISDNGPPFDSKRMDNFAKIKDIELRRLPPYHPSSNPAETFMRPLGKGMKIGAKTGIPEKESLKSVIQSYRQTPHPATGLPPAAMIFRDGFRGDFPRQQISDSEIDAAKLRDSHLRQINEGKINSSKYRSQSGLEIGDMVYVRNFNRRRKFDPLFLEVPFVITDINKVGNKMQVQQVNDEVTYWRHPDDLKRYYGEIVGPGTDIQQEDTNEVPTFHEDSYDDTSYFQQQVEDRPALDEDQGPVEQEVPQLRRSTRTATQNPRYFNDEFVVNNVSRCVVWV